MERGPTIYIPPVNFTPAEIDDLRAEEEKGLIPKGSVAQYFENLNKAVFGHDAKKDRKGHYQEQGVGSKGHETSNHFAALARNEQMGLERPGSYALAVTEMWKRDAQRAEKLRLPRPEALKQAS